MMVRSRSGAAIACILAGVAVLTIATACGRAGDETVPAALTPTAGAAQSDSPSYRATPCSQSPAAGICDAYVGDVITFTIYPDIPDPRCAEARPEQRLRVVNGTFGSLHVVIGEFEADIEPAGQHTFDAPVGDYLAPGVHLVEASPCCSPELWLKPESPEPGTVASRRTA